MANKNNSELINDIISNLNNVIDEQTIDDATNSVADFINKLSGYIQEGINDLQNKNVEEDPTNDVSAEEPKKTNKKKKVVVTGVANTKEVDNSCECNAECSCHKDNGHACKCKEKATPTSKTIAENLKEYYDEKVMQDEEIAEDLLNLILTEYMQPKELGGKIEQEGDVLTMTFINNSNLNNASKVSTLLSEKLIIATGFSDVKTYISDDTYKIVFFF